MRHTLIFLNKMTTHFTNSTGNAANYRRYKYFADSLVIFIINSSPAFLDFSNLLIPKRGLVSSRPLIQRNIVSNSSDPLAFQFHSRLLRMNLKMKTNQQWWDFLGEIVECTIYKLLLDKYNSTILQEKVAQVLSGHTVVADMHGKSMDLTVWDITHDHGEMHEVKKALVSKVKHKKSSSFPQKLVIISNFKADLNASGRKNSFLGVATLLETTAAAEAMLRAIAPTAQVDVLGRDGLKVWMTKSYL